MQQSNQKIQNPKVEMPNTPQMNEQDFLNDMLSTEKYMTTSYSFALNEASHKALYDDLALICKETDDMQRELYNLMFKKGWYSLEGECPQKLQQSYTKFQGYSSQFPYGLGQTQ